jgi:predicted extracellular nuclease
VDALGWGDAPENYYSGNPAAAPAPGTSLERLPGGEEGNGLNSSDNSADFAPNPSPLPQNSGSEITPLSAERLAIDIQLPVEAVPGSEVELLVEVQNLTGAAATDLQVSIPLPDNFEISLLPDGATETEGHVTWRLNSLADGSSESIVIRLTSPWTYLSSHVRGAYVQAGNWPLRAYAPPLTIAVAGGSIPIATARTLTGKTVTVEGIATMYTDAFYAGSTGTKFYLEDESGGIQVYCPGGMGLVEVAIGDRVRVSGEIDVYRTSVEIIPATYPDDVEVLEQGVAEPAPTDVSIQAAGSDESLPGRLIVVEGIATRIEEFSYSYEIDLIDDQGYSQLLYIEKETGVSVEPFELGRIYRVTGISELYDGQWQLKPRQQSDFSEVFPPELMLELVVQNSAQPGTPITYTLTAYNHTDAPLTELRIVLALPGYNLSIHEPLDGGVRDGGNVIWTIPELAPDGGSVTVRHVATLAEEASGQIVTPPAVATADEWPDQVRTPSIITFVGSGVPIWAIQGDGPASPYVRAEASTEGVVTGIFPELGGFWMQQVEPGVGCTTCSSGIFVLTDDAEIDVAVGDLVQLTGKVRERSGQTMLHLQDIAALTVLSSNNPRPAAVELDPPRDATQAMTYYEALEGMLVQVSQPAVVVAPTTKYGETALVSAHWGIDKVMRGDPTGLLIFLDDGSSMTHYSLETLPYALRRGDTVTQVMGPLAFTYENYKIEPISGPGVEPSDRTLPTLPSLEPNTISIATFNVENLFDFQEPHPSDPPLPSLAEYKHKLSKTAEAIRAMGAPAVIGVQEVENIDVLEDLVEQDAILEFDYQPFLVEGTDSRGIDVAYLVRGDQATVENAVALPAPEGLTSRPPLLITVTLQLADAPTLYLLNNHFTSMSGGEKPTESRRNAQALWNLTMVERILASEPDAYVVVMGDLNSFYDSLPLDSLRDGGLEHIYQLVEPDIPYTYIYEGECENLDHILVTPSLYEHLVGVEAFHINADYPLPAADDASPMRVSDHDPLIAFFQFE